MDFSFYFKKQVLGQNNTILNNSICTTLNNGYNLKNQMNINCLNLIKIRQPWRLKTNSPIKQNQIIIEYFGKIIHVNELGQELVSPNGPSCLSPLPSSSTVAITTPNSILPSNPFLVYYNNLENFSICVDSTTCGNISRFMRRSCQPNCNLKHLIDVNGQLHFIVVSICNIPKNVELTLPYEAIYDHRYDFKGHYTEPSPDSYSVFINI
jgi:hypothetical protein